MRFKVIPILITVFWLAAVQAESQVGSPVLEEKYRQAMALMAAFQFDQAQALLSDCYHHEPSNTDYLLKIAYCNVQTGRYPDAKLFYAQVLKLDSLNAEALGALGNIAERESNYGKAAGYYQRLIQMDSTNAFYFKKNGFAARRRGQALPALGYFLRANELNDKDIETIDQLTDIYLALNQLDYAGQILAKGLQLDPRNLKLLYNKATLENKLKNYDLVAAAVEAAMEQGDTSDYFQMLLGVAYLHLDSLDRAVFHLKAICDREADSEYTHHFLGLAYRQQGQIDEAALEFEKAIEMGISDKMPDFHADLAAILENRNQRKAAIAHFQAAYDFDPRPEFLFDLARNADHYYKDKKIALRQYEQYLATGHQAYREVAAERVRLLKEQQFFSK